MKNSELYDYVFHFNPYEQLWYAFKRDQANDYWNDRDAKKNEKFLKAKDIKVLLGYIKETE
jgi:hypothetical protein